MVKVGFIVEGDCERIVVESANFTKFLSDCGQELVTPVIDAKGGGNLLPHHIDAFIQVLEMKAVSKIYVLTDLEEEVSADVVRDRESVSFFVCGPITACRQAGHAFTRSA